MANCVVEYYQLLGCKKVMVAVVAVLYDTDSCDLSASPSISARSHVGSVVGISILSLLLCSKHLCEANSCKYERSRRKLRV